MSHRQMFKKFLLCFLWSVMSMLLYTYIAEEPLLIKMFEFERSGKVQNRSEAMERSELRNSEVFAADSSQVESNKVNRTSNTRPSTTRKVILMWNAVSWFKTKEIKSGFTGHCPITTNRSLVYDKNTAAVIINAWSKTSLNPPIDNRRRPDQLYVFWSTETPGRTRFLGDYEIDLELYPPHYFNATMSYRRDSTFFHPIQRHDVVNMIRSSWHGVESNTKRLLAGKNKTAVLVASNCEHGTFATGRLKLAQEMIDLGFKVDRFGHCFAHNEFSLPKESRRSTEFVRFLEKYKFFMAFENSLHCRDYISEKFFDHGLTAGLLPVVAGTTKADYLAVAPANSFVHVEDFNSTRELVEYLNYLDRNHTAYAEYFRWRRGSADKHFRPRKATGFRALCRALHGISMDDTRSYGDIYASRKHSGHVTPAVNQTIPSIHKWWRVDESRECIYGM